MRWQISPISQDILRKANNPLGIFSGILSTRYNKEHDGVTVKVKISPTYPLWGYPRKKDMFAKSPFLFRDFKTFPLKLCILLCIGANFEVSKFTILTQECFSFKLNILNEGIKLTNEEKSLFNAFQKFESQIRNASNDSDIMSIFKRAFADPKSNAKACLLQHEAVELLKYLDKSHLIDELKLMKVPKFEINAVNIFNLEILNEKTGENVKLSEYLIKNSLKFRVNQIVYDLRMLWIDSNFALSIDDLLKKCDKQFLEKYFIVKKK